MLGSDEGAVLDESGHIVEPLGVVDNLMLHCTCEESGGAVVQAAPGQVNQADLWTDLVCFEKCIRLARELFMD